MTLGAKRELNNNATAEEMPASKKSSIVESHSDEEDEEEEDDEPRLKYASLTKSQSLVYRNGDATSTFIVVGDKMIIGTHNGHTHVLALPSLQTQRVYHAHSASITSISVSPNPLPFSAPKPDAIHRISLDRRENSSHSRSPSASTTSPSSKSARQPQVPPTPSNLIHIATSSIDGNVCVSSLVDPKDVLLRNFGRPVQAVALSPNYKSDRSYISGGLSGNLILTVGGRPGTSSTSHTTGSVSSAASGWLGTIGLGASNGTDTVLHSGEGAISTIKWSLSGKYIVWVNEHGIKIMRSNLQLESGESDLSWKRMNHIDRPTRSNWADMAGVWKARIEWVNEDGLETDDMDFDSSKLMSHKPESAPSTMSGDFDFHPLRKRKTPKRIERLVVGWGDTIWIIDVHPAGPDAGNEVIERRIGRVELVTILRTDCIVSGVSLYTHSLLVILAYILPKENNQQTSNTTGTPKRGVHRRQNALQPEMRIIDVNTKEEVCAADTLNFSRFGSLSATDYHLGFQPALRLPVKVVAARGPLELIGDIGGGIRDATLYPTRLFSSAASIRSVGSDNEKVPGSKATGGIGIDASSISIKSSEAPHSTALTKGVKIFIQSPYDCVLATKPTLADHLGWLDSHERYEEAWQLLDHLPEAMNDLPDAVPGSAPSTPTRTQGSLADFFTDDSSQTTAVNQDVNPRTEKEKQRIGEKWLQQLVDQEQWVKAGETTAKVLGTSSSWEHWVWVFASADKYEEIIPFIPTTQFRPPLPSVVYEMVLAHCISNDRPRLKALLERWPPELFDVGSIIIAIEDKLRMSNVRNGAKGDEISKDWRILTDGLAKLYLANGRARDALKCYIKLQDADSAMQLISEYHLVDVVSDDIPSLILLRISEEQQKSAPLSELEESSIEAIRLLVDEAHQGIVQPEIVVSQLEHRPEMRPYLFFYFRALWNGDTTATSTTTHALKPISATDHLAASEGKTLVNDFADIALRLFAQYDRPLLFSFLKVSQSYNLETASTICDKRQYIPELVYLLSKEGRTKRALSIIIDKLQDVSQAIAFAKDQDDPDLWNDLLNYSMDKPSFVRGLLEEVGTAINPITLVRRIPEGLEIEGLRESLTRMVKEYELQDSISEGVARVLRGEVAMGMTTLRMGQKKGIKFEALVGGRPGSRHAERTAKHRERFASIKPGHCNGCGEKIFEDEKQIILGFSCGHVFHFPCLVTYSSPSDDAEEEISSPIPEFETGPPHDQGIGPKINHAKKLRGRIENGCPIAVYNG